MALPSYPGIYLQKRSIAITFGFKGSTCRETFHVEPNKTNIETVKKKRDLVLLEIGFGTFDYGRHFPESKKALEFSDSKASLITIGEALKEWIIRKQAECQHSTIKDYNNSIWNYLLPKFQHTTLDELRPTQVKTWLASLKGVRNGKQLSNKRKNNILVPLRGIFEDAFYDEVIEKNPMARIKNLNTEQREPKPLNLIDIGKVLAQMEGQEKNYFQFAFWSGLRTSELIGLKWEDIDLENEKVFVRRAIVKGREKTTKTKSGLRTIDLQPQALDALNQQAPFTQNLNKWVFHDPNHNTRWKNENPMRKRVWVPALKRACLEYRNPYQSRHTFASMMLSNGKNPMWVAQQMGHSDWGMIRKVYGRWIP